MKREFPHRSIRPSRRGVYVLELVLILPIIMLVLAILYQVSVMFTTYQALRMTVFDAAMAVAKSDETNVATEVENTIRASVQGHYFGRPGSGTLTITQATDANSWNTEGTAYQLKYRILVSSDFGVKWSYFSSTGQPTTGNLVAVELKLENAETEFPQYWLLGQFKSVEDAKSNKMVLSQIVRRK